MLQMSVLTEAELDAVNGGSFSINFVGFSFQGNSSRTSQGQFNAALVNLGSSQGGGQLAQTGQSNSIG